MNSPPTQKEAFSELTFRSLQDAKMGVLNMVNTGLFKFNSTFDGKINEAESIVNSTYEAVSIIFKDWDFSEEGAQIAAERFVNEFGNRIVSDAQNLNIIQNEK
jgi:hypothetical protein